MIEAAAERLKYRTYLRTMVKPLEKSIKFWDGHGLLRLVEL